MLEIDSYYTVKLNNQTDFDCTSVAQDTHSESFVHGEIFSQENSERTLGSVDEIIDCENNHTPFESLCGSLISFQNDFPVNDENYVACIGGEDCPSDESTTHFYQSNWGFYFSETSVGADNSDLIGDISVDNSSSVTINIGQLDYCESDQLEMNIGCEDRVVGSDSSLGEKGAGCWTNRYLSDFSVQDGNNLSVSGVGSNSGDSAGGEGALKSFPVGGGVFNSGGIAGGGSGNSGGAAAADCGGINSGDPLYDSEDSCCDPYGGGGANCVPAGGEGGNSAAVGGDGWDNGVLAGCGGVNCTIAGGGGRNGVLGGRDHGGPGGGRDGNGGPGGGCANITGSGGAGGPYSGAKGGGG